MSSQGSPSSPERPPLVDDAWCFVCGRENPHGLHTTWTLDADGAARATFQAQRHHQGWRGVIHGGILAALLDEAMAQWVRLSGASGVTADLNIRFRKPAPTDGVLVVEATPRSEERRITRLHASVRGKDGICYAEADGLYVRIGPG